MENFICILSNIRNDVDEESALRFGLFSGKWLLQVGVGWNIAAGLLLCLTSSNSEDSHEPSGYNKQDLRKTDTQIKTRNETLHCSVEAGNFAIKQENKIFSVAIKNTKTHTHTHTHQNKKHTHIHTRTHTHTLTCSHMHATAHTRAHTSGNSRRIRNYFVFVLNLMSCGRVVGGSRSIDWLLIDRRWHSID